MIRSQARSRLITGGRLDMLEFQKQFRMWQGNACHFCLRYTDSNKPRIGIKAAWKRLSGLQWSRVICSFVILLSSFACDANELLDRKALDQQVRVSFFSQDFQQLEKIAADFRVNETRTSSGLWELTLYYGGFSYLSNGMHHDYEFGVLDKIIQNWLTEYPQSSTAHIAKAIILLDHAWFYRGGGWARDVKPENWKPFEEYVGKAREYLEKHKSVASQDPQWYETMLDIAKLQSWPLDDFLELMNEATSRYPYFYQIYFTGLGYLTPKWHGDKEQIEAFARAAVEKTKQKEKMGMYARVYWVASQAQYGPRLFTDSAVVWKTMRQGIKDVMEKYPDGWNTNNFAYFSCLAHDRDMTRDLIGKIHYPLIRQVWRNESTFGWCQKWAHEGEV
jgi:hypothetical protein